MSTQTQASPLPMKDQVRLIRACTEGPYVEISAKEMAYSPHSKFRVGAALLTTDGRVIKGSSIDNGFTGGSICAERTALVKAVSEGFKTFVALAVTSDVAFPISPCGICRQFIREFCEPSMPVFLIPSDYDAKTMGLLVRTVGELLPD